MEHIHLLVSTFDTSNVAVAHNLRSCSRPPSETKTETKTREAKTKTKTKTSRVETKTKIKTPKSGLDRSRDQDQVSRPTSLDIGGLDPSPRKYAVEVRPSENVAFFHSKLLLDNCKFPIINNERLVSKMEGKTIFLRRMKQFDCLTGMTNPHILRQIYATRRKIISTALCCRPIIVHQRWAIMHTHGGGGSFNYR